MMCSEDCFNCGNADCVNPSPYSIRETNQRRAACRRYYQRNRERILAQKAECYRKKKAGARAC